MHADCAAKIVAAVMTPPRAFHDVTGQ